MAEVVNLRTVRKQAKRTLDEARASANRLAHSQPKAIAKLKAAQEAKASRDLEGHRIGKGDGR